MKDIVAQIEQVLDNLDAHQCTYPNPADWCDWCRKCVKPNQERARAIVDRLRLK